MQPREVIVAPATAHGRAAIAVVRVTGPGTLDVASRVVRPRRPGEWRAGRARRVDLVDRDGPIDDGLAVWFAGPRSYTGEDLLEVSIHGNPELVARAVAAFVDAGARVAHPGEFTRRAVVNGRLDLVRAEGVDQLVRAVGPAGVAVARDAVSGRLSAALAAVRAAVIELAAETEARLDFPDDELALTSDAEVLTRLAALERQVRALADTARAGRIRVDGATVALVGPVNAGKSSLFNALLGEVRAIVHPTPGTTRDRVEARARWGTLDVTLVDTAGDRDTDDPVEALGVELARAVVQQADLVVVVVRCRPGGLDPSER
ncbi:MAG: GTPase, partial [Myxococcota bacterium]